MTFKDFLFKDKRNRIVLYAVTALLIIQWLIFKYYYPFANYIHGDSFAYLKAANENLEINTYLIGYSKFLRLLSVFSKSDYTLASIQYLIIQLSTLFLLFTLFYLYRLSILTQLILLAFATLNPLSLHLGNLISSDCIFAALSMLWLSTLIWLIYKPSLNIIALHSILLFLCFIIRYNALIYPLFSILIIVFNLRSWKLKLISFTLIIIPCLLFVLDSRSSYRRLVGISQYSPFSGWQLANNAMYAYRYVDKNERIKVPQKYRQLDSMITTYFDKTRDGNIYLSEKIKASTYYMWSRGLPLYKYRDSIVFKGDTITSELAKWAFMGPLYKSYGIYIISNYPDKFIEHFAYPNFKKYYSPPLEFLRVYNSGRTKVSKDAATWFNYKSVDIYTKFRDNNIVILKFLPILSGIINVIMLFGVFAMLVFRVINERTIQRQILLVAIGLWIVNALFTILASSAALRFQSFPIIISTIFSTLIVERLFKEAFKASSKSDTNFSNVVKEKDICINSL